MSTSCSISPAARARDADAGGLPRVSRSTDAGVGTPVGTVPRHRGARRSRGRDADDAVPLSDRDRARAATGARACRTCTSALCASLRAHGMDAPDGRRRRSAASAASRRSPPCTAITRPPERAILHHVCELLLDHDEAIARWRFHHAQMVAREIGITTRHRRQPRRRVPRERRSRCDSSPSCGRCEAACDGPTS